MTDHKFTPQLTPELGSNSMFLYISVIVSLVISFFVGWRTLQALREVSKSPTSPSELRLVSLTFAAPMALFVLLNILTAHGLIHRALTNAISLGAISGVLSCLNKPPSGKNTVKLVVRQIDGKRTDVWIDSKDILLDDLKARIAEALGIKNRNRISIESGQGSMLDDTSKPFSSMISESSISVNFFGFSTTTCYITVLEEESNELENLGTVTKSNNPFRMLMPKADAKYGEQYTLSARVLGGASDTFLVSIADKFAAANPIGKAPLMSMPQVRLLTWSESIDITDGDAHSEAGDTVSVNSSAISPSSNGESTKKSSLWKSKLIPGIRHKSGAVIRNGDVVVLEYQGKFMSVTRGWWLQCISTSPRRSGAFRIEIVERQQQINLANQIKEQFTNIKEKMRRQSIMTSAAPLGSLESSGSPLTSPGNHSVATAATSATGNTTGSNVAATSAKDDILRQGDSFRLRSVKFPEYELGVTNVKIRDEFCYLGLRKVCEDNANDEWCTHVTFKLKSTPLGAELFHLR